MHKFSGIVAAMSCVLSCALVFSQEAYAQSSLSSDSGITAGSSKLFWNQFVGSTSVQTGVGPCATYTAAIRALKAQERQSKLDGGTSSKMAVVGSSATGALSDAGLLDLTGSSEGSSVGSSTLSQAFNPFYNQPWKPGMPGQMPLLEGHTTAVSMVTGPGSPSLTHRQWGVAGTDLGFSFLDPDGKTMLVFGDTMDCVSAGDGWRSNVILRTTDDDYTDGVTISDALTSRGYATSGAAQEFITSRKDAAGAGGERTVIPTSGITIGDTMYVDFMSVRDWGNAGEWTTNYAGTVKSTDGANWFPVYESGRMQADTNTSGNGVTGTELVPWSGNKKSLNSKLQMSSFAVENGDSTYVYRYSTPSGRFGAAILGRALQSEFPKESAWEYYVDGSWVSGDEGLRDATEIFSAPVSELSVQWNEYLQKYVALYQVSNGIKGGMIMRTADNLEGPWSDQRMIISTTEVTDLYGGFVLPHQEGKYLYWVGTTWSAYNVILFRTDLDEFLGTVTQANRPLSTEPDYDIRWDSGLKLNGVVNYAEQEVE